MLPFLFSLLLCVDARAQEKLLDKIVAVVSGRLYSLSEVDRTLTTLPARREIAPFIYPLAKYDQSQILDIMIQAQIVRDRLSTQGYVVGDDSVESRIKMTEEKLGLSRDSLLEFLKSKGVTYEEYFEIIRESMEYNLFRTQIITPLISVTEQEIKNEFYKRHSSDKALSFTYSLVDFSVPAEEAKGKDPLTFTQALQDYQLTGRLGYGFRDMDSNPLENVKEDSLSPKVAEALTKSSEGGFTPPVVLGDRLHSFFVKKKDLVESAAFMKAKDQLQEEIYMEKGQSLTKNWFEREYNNYYIKKNL